MHPLITSTSDTFHTHASSSANAGLVVLSFGPRGRHCMQFLSYYYNTTTMLACCLVGWSAAACLPNFQKGITNCIQKIIKKMNKEEIEQEAEEESESVEDAEEEAEPCMGAP